VVGAGDADGIHIFLLQDLAKILLLCGASPIACWVWAANLSIVLLSTSAHVRDKALSLLACSADKWAYPRLLSPITAKIQAIVGAENLSIAFGVGADRQPSCSHRERIEKLTTIDHSSPPFRSHNQPESTSATLYLRIDECDRR